MVMVYGMSWIHSESWQNHYDIFIWLSAFSDNISTSSVESRTILEYDILMDPSSLIDTSDTDDAL